MAHYCVGEVTSSRNKGPWMFIFHHLKSLIVGLDTHTHIQTHTLIPYFLYLLCISGGDFVSTPLFQSLISVFGQQQTVHKIYWEVHSPKPITDILANDVVTHCVLRVVQPIDIVAWLSVSEWLKFHRKINLMGNLGEKSFSKQISFKQGDRNLRPKSAQCVHVSVKEKIICHLCRLESHFGQCSLTALLHHVNPFSKPMSQREMWN